MDEETKAPRGHGLSHWGRGPSGILGHADPSHRPFHCSRVRNTAGGQADPLPEGTKNSDNSVRKRQKPTGKLAKVLNRLFMRGSPSGEKQTSPRMGTRTHHGSERLGLNTANTSAGGRRESQSTHCWSNFLETSYPPPSHSPASAVHSSVGSNSPNLGMTHGESTRSLPVTNADNLQIQMTTPDDTKRNAVGLPLAVETGAMCWAERNQHSWRRSGDSTGVSATCDVSIGGASWTQQAVQSRAVSFP